MKKSRIVLLVAALLALAMMLSACGKVEIASIGEYLNADYDLSEDVYAKATALSALEGYSAVETLSSDKFVVFALQDTKDGKITTSYKIFSMFSGAIVQEFIDTEDVDFDFSMNGTSFVVQKTVLDASTINMTPDAADLEKVALAQAVTAYRAGIADDAAKLLLDDYITDTYTLYDGTGAEMATTKYEGEYDYFAGMTVYDDVAYTVDEKTGAWTKKVEIPEYMTLDNLFMKTEEYYYGGTDYALTVYDQELNVIATFPVPDYGDESAISTYEMFDGVYPMVALNNGDIVYQYGMVQDEDAKEYDFTYVEDGETFKMNLVTVLFSLENKEMKELEFDYVITALTSNDAVYNNLLPASENTVLEDAFENIATLAPIVDGRVLFAEDKQDFVILDNELKVVKSLKLVENQINEVPEKIADDLYKVELMSGGVALVNGAGEVQKIVNNELNQVGAYFVGENAIYDLSLNKVQDLKDPDVSYKTVGESIFVTTKINSKEYKVVALRDGKTTDVYTQTKDSKTKFVLGDGYYYIVNEANDYKYYTVTGEELVTTKRALEVVKASDESCVAILKGLPIDIATEKVVYYAFTK